MSYGGANGEVVTVVVKNGTGGSWYSVVWLVVVSEVMVVNGGSMVKQWQRI